MSEREFKPADSFDAWFLANEDLIHEMIRSDQYELMYEVWIAGYQLGLANMGDMLQPLVAMHTNTDDSTDSPTDGDESK